MEFLDKSSYRSFVAVVAVTALSLWGQAIEPGASPEQPENSGAVFRANTRVVDLHATVLDKKGRLITNLPREAFSVIENGIPQQIGSFKREDAPVSMGLIIDNSASMWDKRAKVKAAALTLVNDSNPQDEVFVVNFNHRVYFDLPHGRDFTNDIREMEAALARIDSNGLTAMRDAIRKSITHLEEKAHKDKRVLVVVTDGNDNTVKAAQQSGVLIYSVGLLTEEDPWKARTAKRELTALAKATGGESYFPTRVSSVERIAHKVASDIRNQYSIVYTPSNQLMDGTFREIKVTVNGPRNLIVRTRSGYYATSDQPTLRAAPVFQ